MSAKNLYTRPFDHFPTRSDHNERWAQLARSIAAEREQMTDDPAAIQPATVPGELIVIGSGIEAVGFTSSDEILIREADHIFFCVADPATSVWIKAVRPDAYDLYVLYDDSKLRYLTYMQMTEAILHLVRKGRKVVAIYYGHPGIFVLSTHRAVRIAQREGHRAVMRAGISALDTLCADLGVDPSQPGMQIFEATDMLIRQRRPDRSLHLVLWQVGLIGELGYRRHGYFNSGFSILLDYLEEVYGPDHIVINYIGSRYPGIEPITDAHTITTLRTPQVQATVTGISTFYLPPKEAIPGDRTMLEKLRLLKPGQTTKPPTHPLREIDRYGPRELKAFDDFAHFRVPMGYHWQEDTAAARFILALREDSTLRNLYNHDPAAAVATAAGSELGVRERSLLARRDAGAMQIAAKGIDAKADPEAARMLRTLLTRKSQACGLLRAVCRAEPHSRISALECWSTQHGYIVDWSNIPEALALTLRGALYPWTGFYVVPERQMSLFLLGRAGTPASNQVYLNGHILTRVRYNKGILTWRAEDGNPSSGSLQMDLTPRGVRRLVGTIWPGGQKVTSHDQLTALEHHLPNTPPLAALVGKYRLAQAGDAVVEVVVRDALAQQPHLCIEVNGRPSTARVTIGTSGFEVDGLNVPFASMVREAGLPDHLYGDYVVRAMRDGSVHLHHFCFNSGSVMIDHYPLVEIERRGPTVAWRCGPDSLPQGQVTLLLDPITLRPMLFGTGYSVGKSEASTLVGMVPVSSADTQALASTPGFGIPDWAWTQLLSIAGEASRRGGLFLWHSWEKTATNLRRVHTALRKAQL